MTVDYTKVCLKLKYSSLEHNCCLCCQRGTRRPFQQPQLGANNNEGCSL